MRSVALLSERSVSRHAAGGETKRVFSPHSRFAILMAGALLSVSMRSPAVVGEDLLEHPAAFAEPRFVSDNPKLLGGPGSDDTIGIERFGGPDGDGGVHELKVAVYDIRRGEERVLDRRYRDGDDGPPRVAPGSKPRCLPSRDSGPDGGGATVFGADGRTEISDTTVTPWNRIGKIYAWFHDPANDLATSSPSQEILYADCVGTGSLIGECYVLTAGHVVYNHDPLCGAIGWAEKLIFVPGLYTDSSGVVRWPFGSQYATQIMSFTGWTQNEDEDDDMGFFVLDQPVGATTGWFGYSTGSSDGTIRNISGYPVDRASGLDQFFMAGEINCENTYNLKYKIDTFGGQSGAPIWSYDGTDRLVRAVHAHGNVAFGCGFETQNRGVRITSGKFDAIQDWKADYECPEPASDLGDNGDSSGHIRDFELTPHLLPLSVIVQNLGLRPVRPFRVAAVLSRDDVITRDDTFIGVGVVDEDLGCRAPVVVRIEGRLPRDMEPGTYYLGWVIDPDDVVEESDERNNVGVLRSEEVVVHDSREMELRRRLRRFLRGDSNDDARFDISDPIRLLRHLFLGDPPPSCLDAADNNGDGKLDLSDSISALSDLFLGTGPVRSCADEAPATKLGCASYSHCK